MSASEKSGQNPSRRFGPHLASDRAGTPRGADRAGSAGEGRTGTAGTRGPVTMGELLFLPLPPAEEARAAAPAARGAGDGPWSAVRSLTAVTAGAVSATAAITAAYALGHRAGRRGRGPAARFFERRF
ncbi:hypothetical protein ABZ926_19895 [Streptomyces litmocidini]|uniref:Uncharacterized protein n=1 Tax=Streptomyces litmocidini TaxID=67318 RepID=A0ABW7U9K1_9ACTN|nr:hypothetical protein [Streptomyces sp. PanSC19]ROQ26613.1 hypothetical protein EDD98_6258 [Streptomyces sp. PanSC19]